MPPEVPAVFLPLRTSRSVDLPAGDPNTMREDYLCPPVNYMPAQVVAFPAAAQYLPLPDGPIIAESRAGWKKAEMPFRICRKEEFRM